MSTATLYAATLRLADPVVSATVVHDVRTSLFLRVDDDVAGWSECPVAMGPGADATADEVRDALVAELSGRSTAVTPATLAARGMLATARLDARLRRESVSLARFLDVRDTAVGFAGVLGVQEHAAAVAHAESLVALGATRLRVKVTPTSGVESIAAVLDVVSVPIVADANGSFDPGDDVHMGALRALAALPLAWLEQPFAPSEDAAVELLSGTGVRVGADESVRSPAALDDLLQRGDVAVVCIKPARVGVAVALGMLRAASNAGVDAYVGGYFEAGLGRAALGAVSAAAATLDGDVVSPSTYLLEDPCHLDGPHLGRQPLHDTPGIGPVPDEHSLVFLGTFDARESSPHRS